MSHGKMRLNPLLKSLIKHWDSKKELTLHSTTHTSLVRPTTCTENKIILKMLLRTRNIGMKRKF